MDSNGSPPSTPDQDVSPDFIEQSRKADLCKPRQKFAPYTKSQRRKRRAEVYRLHFEKGMPAVRIAEAMKVDRNTINSDLKILYEEVGKDLNASTYADLILKQLVRLETQRDRLTSYLADETDNEKKLATERLLAAIDIKLMAALEKMQHSDFNHWISVLSHVNKLSEAKGLGKAYTGIEEMVAISVKSRQDLDEVMKKVHRWP